MFLFWFVFLLVVPIVLLVFAGVYFTTVHGRDKYLGVAFLVWGIFLFLLITLIVGPSIMGTAKTKREQGAGEYKVLAYAQKGKSLYLILDGSMGVFTVKLPKKAVEIEESNQKSLVISYIGSFKSAILYWPKVKNSKEIEIFQENGCDTLTYTPKNTPKTIKLKLNYELETLSLITPNNITVFRLDTIREPKIEKEDSTI